MLFLFFSFFAFATANPIISEQAPEVPKAEAQVGAGGIYYYGVDLSGARSSSQMTCLKQGGYSDVIARAYDPSNGGVFDSTVCNNIKYAYNAGLGTEAYMTPNINSRKNATQQIDEVYNGLVNCGLTVRGFWIQVVSPLNWGSQSANVNFIQSMLNRIRARGLMAAIYTSAYDWNQITGNWNGASSAMLWYYNVYGGGVNGETTPTFSDFAPFGGWYYPEMKQFGQQESVCSITVNRNVYQDTSITRDTAEEKDEGIVVGRRIRSPINKQ